MDKNTPDNASSSETRVAAVAAAAAAAAVAAAAPPRRRRTGGRRLFQPWFLAGGAGGVLIVLYAWRLPPFSSAIVSTENALVRGQVTLIGTQLPGYVVDVKVQDFQYVKQGDLLAQIDDRTYQQRYAQAWRSWRRRRRRWTTGRSRIARRKRAWC
jgi:multidrug resistance efflux pump